MMYPLEAPNGWFLLEMRHEHTPIRYATDHHEPVQKEGGAWFVQFQKYPKGGQATFARGNSMEEAWKNACDAVARRERGKDDDMTGKKVAARAQGYSGDICTNCSGVRMKWAGHCQVCEDCGSTTGCS